MPPSSSGGMEASDSRATPRSGPSSTREVRLLCFGIPRPDLRTSAGHCEDSLTEGILEAHGVTLDDARDAVRFLHGERQRRRRPGLTRGFYGDPKLARLWALRRAWNPDSVFHVNHNVTPATS